MAKDDKSDDSQIISLQDWKAKKASKEDKIKTYIAKRRKVVELKLNPEEAELLAKVKERMGGSITARIVFLRGLSVLNQYLELQATGGQLLLIMDGNDEEIIDFDFE